MSQTNSDITLKQQSVRYLKKRVIFPKKTVKTNLSHVPRDFNDLILSQSITACL